MATNDPKRLKRTSSSRRSSTWHVLVTIIFPCSRPDSRLVVSRVVEWLASRLHAVFRQAFPRAWHEAFSGNATRRLGSDHCTCLFGPDAREALICRRLHYVIPTRILDRCSGGYAAHCKQHSTVNIPHRHVWKTRWQAQAFEGALRRIDIDGDAHVIVDRPPRRRRRKRTRMMLLRRRKSRRRPLL